MSEYLRFPFLSGATAIPDKTDHQKEVETEDPKIVATRERKARVVAKKSEKKKRGLDEEEGSRPQGKRKKKTFAARRDSSAASERVSSLEPIRMADPVVLNMENPSGGAANIAESQGDQSLHASHHDSDNHSVHEDQTEMNLTIVPIEVLQPSPSDHSVHRSLTTERTTSPARLSAQGAHGDEGGSSRDQAYYVPKWFIHRRCRALAQADMLERYKNLQTDYNSLAKAHADCEDTVRQLIEAREASQQSSRLYLEMSERELSQVNKLQALKIKELEYTLARKDSALVYAERINDERAQEKERLIAQLSKQRWKNLIVFVGWRKGLDEERSEEDLLALMSRMEGFDVYADKKMRVEYDKLFEKKYPYVEKISRGFCHSVSDLLKVYLDSPPSRQAPSNRPSFGKVAPTSSLPL
nr:hypothetical protein [Tanacetum cinerariifolium]